MKKTFENRDGSVLVALSGVEEGILSRRELITGLDSAEKRRLAELRRPGDQTRFVASRWLLRETLSEAFGGEPGRWRFRLLPSGQWALAEEMALPKARFSLAHAGGAVAAAVSAGSSVGIDLEPLSLSPLELPIDAALTLTERRWLSGLTSGKRETETLRIWTLKEAFAKLQGLGIDLDFTRFEVGTSPARLVWAGPEIRGAEKVRFVSRELEISRVPYQISLAVRSESGALPPVEWRNSRAAWSGNREESWTAIS
jgi:phosphopantetheinyl transferase